MGLSSSKSSSSTPLPSIVAAGFLRPVTATPLLNVANTTGKAKEPSAKTNTTKTTNTNNESHTLRVETLKNEMM